jgi:hypothetical protein
MEDEENTNTSKNFVNQVDEEELHRGSIQQDGATCCTSNDSTEEIA